MGDGDGGRDAVNPLGSRFVEPFEKLSSVRRETLDVAALPFRIECIQRQARLAAATDPADHDQLPMRNVQVHTLEIVNLDAA